MIFLRVPAIIVYRDLITRAVATECKLANDRGSSAVVGEELATAMISAVGEAFNNAVFHAYAGIASGAIELQIIRNETTMFVELRDFGKSFDFDAVQPPDLAALPESGMGIFIIRSFVDEARYKAGEHGEPNVLAMRKRLRRAT